MKKLNLILFILLSSFITSCDTEYSKELILSETSNITGTITLSSSIASPGFSLGYTVDLPSTFDKIAVVTVEAVGSNSKTTISTVTIPAGNTSGEGTITMPEFGFSGSFEPTIDQVSLQVKGLALFNEVVDEEGNLILENEPSDSITMDSNIEKVTYYERIQWPYGSSTIAGRMTALFDWDNSADHDLDMYMYNASTFEQVESAFSGSRWETDIFDDTHPDGDYFVAIDFWEASGDIPWKIFFVHPNQTDVTYFEGIFEGTASGDFVYPLINFTKTTDTNGEISYIFSQP